MDGRYVKMKEAVDIEPTWIELGRLMIKSKFQGQLDGPLKVADIVRQAQKKGKKKVIFSFDGDDCNVEVC